MRANLTPITILVSAGAVGPARLPHDLAFETSGAAEAESDFRAIATLGPGVDLLSATVDHYALRSGRQPSLERIKAWHVPPPLATPSGGPRPACRYCSHAPGGGTPADYVEELAERFALLGIGP